jgi:hypothetical protein
MIAFGTRLYSSCMMSVNVRWVSCASGITEFGDSGATGNGGSGVLGVTASGVLGATASGVLGANDSTATDFEVRWRVLLGPDLATSDFFGAARFSVHQSASYCQ